MTVKKVSGSKLYIGVRKAYKDVVTVADFVGDTWTEIKGWSEVGELGSEQEVLSQQLVSSGLMHYGKGIMSFPTMTNTFVPWPDDPGQVKFLQAAKSCHPFSFKIEWGADCGEEDTVTISIAAPGIISWVGHGLAAGTPISFDTTGALPTGLSVATVYYVVAPTTDAFSVAATPGGSAIATTGTQSGVHTAYAAPIGETDLFFGLAMKGAKSGGDASATRSRTFNIQPICESLEI